MTEATQATQATATTVTAVVSHRLRAFYGFSRGTQATLSVAQPLIGALLATADPAPERVAAICLAAFAGFFAVFAANDLIDVRLDRRRSGHDAHADAHAHAHADPAGPDIDSAGARHPLATGQLSLFAGTAWVVGLGTVALVITAALSWLCAALFLLAVALEVAYCLLATVTPYKFLLSGIMVAVGALAGWFAVADIAGSTEATGATGAIEAGDLVRLGLLALWLAAWEIGGRNVPNDMADAAEDAPLGIRTMPVRYGLTAGAVLAFACLLVAAAASIGLAVAAWDWFGPAGLAGAVLAAGYALVRPGLTLLRRPDAPTALAAFNRASFHPVWLLLALAAGLLLH